LQKYLISRSRLPIKRNSIHRAANFLSLLMTVAASIVRIFLRSVATLYPCKKHNNIRFFCLTIIATKEKNIHPRPAVKNKGRQENSEEYVDIFFHKLVQR
jgi:hypothetical protein